MTPRITITPNGPYEVTGDVRIVHRQRVLADDGYPIDWRTLADVTPTPDTPAAIDLCRCGNSDHKPLCDGTHTRIDFDGTETAPTTPYDQAAKLRTDHGITTGDVAGLCAHAQFCMTGNTDVWHLLHADLDAEGRDAMLDMIDRCPSGRLTHRDGDATEWDEPDLDAEIVLVADGQIYVTGGIEIIRSNGQPAETRNRVSLCRCGGSGNKPFCDGTHRTNGFTDQPTPSRSLASDAASSTD